MDKGRKEIGEDEEEDDTDSEEEGLGLRDPVSMSDVGSEDETDGDAVNPLLTDLVGDSKELRKARKAENWFSQVRAPLEPLTCILMSTCSFRSDNVLLPAPFYYSSFL